MPELPVKIATPAKINLGLQVVGKRPDGFHRIKTVFQTIGLFDELKFKPGKGDEDQLRIKGAENLETGPENLVNRALKLLREEGFAIPPVSIELTKNIPAGGGLGGGSSDAAAVFHLAELIGENSSLSSKKINKIAASLGADIPFFLEGGTVLGEGIGERLSELPDQEAEVLLAVPDYSIDTEWAYSNLGEQFKNGFPENIGRSSGKVPDRSRAWKHWSLQNQFERLIVAKYPKHKKILNSFSEFTDYFSTTGSGSGIYGLFEDKNKIKEARKALKKKWPELNWFLTSFVSSKNCPRLK